VQSAATSFSSALLQHEHNNQHFTEGQKCLLKKFILEVIIPMKIKRVNYLLMFIIRPTNGWDERARTAPVAVSSNDLMSMQTYQSNKALRFV